MIARIAGVRVLALGGFFGFVSLAASVALLSRLSPGAAPSPPPPPYTTDPILEVHAATLTAYLPTAATL